MEAIVAVDLHNGISKNGIIPWKSKKDMSHFYKQTNGNIVIMGKNTYFSIPEERRPLKNRLNIVLTRQPQNYQDISVNFDNVIFISDYNTLQFSNKNECKLLYPFLLENFKVFVIGGKQIYEKFIPYCHTIWLTQIKCDYKCDLFLFLEDNFNDKMSVTEIDNDDELVIYKYIRN